MVPPVYILMPARNEDRTIARVIAAAVTHLPASRLVAVDDGSTDDTARQAVQAGAFVISLPFNCGYGVALQTALLHAWRSGAELVVTLDADGQHEPGDIPRLLDPILSGRADVAIGSRYLPSSVSYRVPVLRRAASFCMAQILSLLSKQPFTDSTSGFRCLNRKALGLLVGMKDFPEKTPDADLLLYLTMRGCRITELPVTMHADAGGDSMHGPLKSLLYVPHMCLSILGVMLAGKE
jgi:glycosyltransferase involved in cell wall biosynthesis